MLPGKEGRQAGRRLGVHRLLMNPLEEGLLSSLFIQPQFTEAAACRSKCLTCSLPACWACDPLSSKSFPAGGYQGQCWDGPALARILSISILDCLRRHSSLAMIRSTPKGCALPSQVTSQWRVWMESDHCRQGKWSSLWWCCSCGLVSKQLLDRGPMIEGMGLSEGGR